MDHTQYMNILKQAVANEQEAYDFYCKAAEKISETRTTRFFEGIAKDELGHKALLENYVTASAKPLQFETTEDYKVSESVETPALTTDMSFKDAVALAMKKEQEAVEMYTAFANASSDEAQKQVFMELAKMEADHKAGLEDIYVNVAFVEAW